MINLNGPIQTAAFTSTRTRLLDGSLRLWKHPLLIEELRRVRAKDTERIELPRFGGGHCDLASALSLGVYMKRGLTDRPSGPPASGPSRITENAMFAPLDGRAPATRRPDVDGAGRQSVNPPAGWDDEVGDVRRMRF